MERPAPIRSSGTSPVSSSDESLVEGTAFTLASLAQTGEILVDSSVREAIGAEWEIERREGLSGLDDNVEAWSIRLQRASQA